MTDTYKHSMYLTNPSAQSDGGAQLLRFPLQGMNPGGRLVVQRIDSYFFYQVGAALRPLAGLQFATTNSELRPLVWEGQRWLVALLQQSLIELRTSNAKGWELAQTLAQTSEALEKIDDEKLKEAAEFLTIVSITTGVSSFQTLLSAELSLANVYVVGKKGGYDLRELTENGLSIFPGGLAEKVPEAIGDASQAARCLAFELPTAAAFHMHLVLERVMRSYYDVVTGGKPHPEARKITAYIDAMKGHQVGDKRIFAALADVAKFHRNPVLHPDEKLETTEDAIALLGSIFSASVQMLKAMPVPELKLVMQDAETKTA
jgi:hypothetical protein